MTIKPYLKFRLFIIVGLLLLLPAWFIFMRPADDVVVTLPGETFPEEELAEPVLTLPELDEFGLPAGNYRIETRRVQSGHTLSHIFDRFGLSPVITDRVAREMLEVFNPRRMRRGHHYHGYFSTDSTGTFDYFVYEISDLEFLVVDFRDSIRVSRTEKEISIVPVSASGVINSSLWNTLMDNQLNPELAVHMSRILAWSVDFYRIFPGDRFKVLYAMQYVGDRPVGVSHVDAVYFLHHGREVEGYRFEADTIKGYYDAEGNNLRKVFLRAPLEFPRISSRYSHSRLHPIHGDRRPHLGTDYAAPRGTPILAVGDGVVTETSYTRGNGNYVRIRHNSVYETQYLHMSRFATGIRPGVRVTQGQVIGYVGSTGLATGPHVCFRFWKNGRQVDHLRLEFPSGDPLPEEYLDEFTVRMRQLRRQLDAIQFEDQV